MEALNDKTPTEAPQTKLQRKKERIDNSASFFAFRNQVLNRYKESVNSSSLKTRTSKSPNRIANSQTINYEYNLTEALLKETMATISNENSLNKKSSKKGNKIRKQLSSLQGEIGSLAMNSKHTIINTPMLTLNNNPAMKQSAIASSYFAVTPTNCLRQKHSDTKKRKKMNRNCSGPDLLHSFKPSFLDDNAITDKDYEVNDFKKNLWN